MKYFNESEENLRKLKQSLDEWKGTPYKHWCGVKGQGCDCIHFVARVYEEMGYGPFDIKPYPRDWNLHNEEELLFNGILKQLPCDVLPIDIPLQNGDVILYKFGKTISHSGIYFNEEVYQALTDMRVEKLHWKDKRWFKRMKYILRVKAL